ncbi:ATP/GTP-binding protein [Bacteroidota bacterium]
MILNVSFKNFRSFKNLVNFSLVAEKYQANEQNVFTQALAKGEDEVRLLNTALIYGNNASGKTNLLRGLYRIIRFIGQSKPKAGKPIPAYDEFKFAPETIHQPTEFCIEFAGKDSIKYKYELTFNKTDVLFEQLTYWPNNKPVNLFTREIPEENNGVTHFGKLGPSFNNEKIEVFQNQAFLSRFGEDFPHSIITNVYIYLTSIEVLNATNNRVIEYLYDEVKLLMADNFNLSVKLNELLRFIDIGLKGFHIGPDQDTEPDRDSENENIHNHVDSSIGKHAIKGIHPFYDEKNKTLSDVFLPFMQESRGTQTVFSIGGRMLKALEAGEVLFIDELETSLHPFVTRLLIELFQNKLINKKNAQLVFTTHDTFLLDQNKFRKDQVWFAEKNEFGETELFSIQDFTDVRSDTPFNKWYLAGKFGGVPTIKTIESLFSEE